MILALILKVPIFLVVVNQGQDCWFSCSNVLLQHRLVILWSHHVKVLNGQMLLLMIQLEALCQYYILRYVFVFTIKE